MPASVVGIVAAGLLLTTIAFLAIRDWEQRAADRLAADLARNQVEKLRISLLRSLEVLYSIAALHAAEGEITRERFRRFVADSLVREPGLRALSWNPWIRAAERSHLEASARADGLDRYRITEKAGDGRFVEATPNPTHVPVFLIEPLERNQAALGFDLQSDPERRACLERARATGLPTATAPIHLAQNHGNGMGFLVLLPVYRTTAASRSLPATNAVAGFAVAVFDVADLVGPALDELASQGLDAALYDDSPDQPLLVRRPPPRLAAKTADVVTFVDVAGRRWRMIVTPNPARFTGPSHAQSGLALASGLAFTLLASAYLYSGAQRARETSAANRVLQAEIAIRQHAEAAAEAANAAKSDFLASMSHEIRTPLNAILGYTQLLRRDPELTAEQHDTLHGIATSGEHLLGLINEILDLSKIEAGHMEIHVVDFDLAALGRSLAATFRPLCAQKQIGFRIELPVHPTCRVRGDEGKLRQILINLLGNAVKFTAMGEVCLRALRLPDDRWRFEVIDTGIGIPEEEQTEIFNPFHQGGGAQHHGGTGLGLAIASRQVQLLGGVLGVTSTRGAGSLFAFTLLLPPAPSVHAAAEPEVLRLAPHQSVAALVVDDHRANREVLGGLLAVVGCTVRHAATADEAREIARASRLDIVFLDLLLPSSDGVELARELLDADSSRRPPVVAHSASTHPGLRDAALEAGCAEFLAKPFTAAQLYRCLERCLSVRFEYAPPAAEAAAPPEFHPESIDLPDDLFARLAVAAELHSTTALKACLGELRELGPASAALAENLRHLLRSYDMNGILRLLARVPNRRPQPTSAGSPP